MNKEELKKVVADYKATLEETREINKMRAQERALREKPTNGTSETKLFADVQEAMREHRAITLNGTNEVNVAHTLKKMLEEKSDLLSRFSISIGGKASEIIPVWNQSIGEFAPVDEGGTFTGEAGAVAAVNLMPYAFAKEIKLTDEALKLSAVNFEVELKDILSKALSRTILKQIFNGNGTSGQFKSILTGATNITSPTWTAKDLQKFALENICTKTDNGVILMNPSQFAAITDSNTARDKILMEQIENRNIEGVEIILSAYVPSDIYCVGGELSNYGVGIADQMDIKEKPTAGTLLHTYDASAYMNGRPIIEKDFYVLKKGE